MTEDTDRLKKLDDGKLIDVVKNYREYGYDDKLRENAIVILNQRGITTEQLKLTGEFENNTFDRAQALFIAFSKNSKIAFVLYVILLLTIIMVPVLVSNTESLGLLTLAVSWTALIAYLVFLIKSFINQTHFYQTIDQDYGSEGALLYFFLGMPFYIFAYFLFRNQMTEKMNEIK